MTVWNSGDFVWDDEAEMRQPTTTLRLGAATVPNLAEPLIAAAAHRYRIERLPVQAWRQELAGIEDETIREHTRRFLLPVYEARKRRADLEKRGGDKRSAAGDAELAKLQALAARL